MNREAHARWEMFETPRPLSEPIDYQFLEQGLIQPMDQPTQMKEAHSDTLIAWLHVTNACNLACPYCYVRKSSARMDEATGLQAIEQIFHTAVAHGFKSVQLKYAGGEASLNFRLIRLLHETAQQYAAKHDIDLKAVVLSNGYRLRLDDVAWCVDQNVQLMISLDGLGEAHNRQRPLKGGGDTFANVARTIDTVLIPHGIYPYISVTITQQNATHISPVVRWALERDLPVSLNFYRQNAQSMSRQELVLEEASIIAGMQAAYEVFEELLPERPFLNGLLDLVQTQAHTHTCGVQSNYIVVSHTGQIAQCHMELGQAEPVHNRDYLHIIQNGGIQNVHVDEKEGCRTCPFRYRCTGGCPLETYRATGRWDVKSPNCNIYRTLYPLAMRLEGLRLLKVHNILA